MVDNFDVRVERLKAVLTQEDSAALTTDWAAVGLDLQASLSEIASFLAPVVVAANEAAKQVRALGFGVINALANDKTFRRERERYLRRRRQTRATFHGR